MGKKKRIDCLLIGSYEMEFAEHLKILNSVGIDPIFSRFVNFMSTDYNDKTLSAWEYFHALAKNKDMNHQKDDYNIFSNTIAYLGTFLNKHGYSFDYIKNFAKQKEELIEILTTCEIGTIAIITTTYRNPFPIRKLVLFIRKYLKNVKIIAGGPYINGELRNNSEKEGLSILKSIGADLYVNSPQGELTLIRILEKLEKEEALSDIPNLYISNGNAFVKTKVEVEDNKLEENLIDWSLFKEDLPKHIVSRLSISCPFRCSFCDFPQRVGDYKYMDLEHVEKELDEIERTKKVCTINFTDDTFNIPKKRFKDIMKLMVDKKYSFTWNSFLRCQFIDDEICKLVSKAGCKMVHLGIESGSQSILSNMNKKATLDAYKRGIELLHKNNILTCASFIIGFPGETEQTVNETINFIEETGIDFYMLQLWYCSPMTPIWNERDKFRIEGGYGYNWKHSTMNSFTAIQHMERILQSVKNSTFSGLHIHEIMILTHELFTIDELKGHLDTFKNKIVENIQLTEV